MPYNAEPDSQVTQTPVMTTPILRLFAIAAAICLAATSAAGDSPDRTLFTNVHVFNGMDGKRLENANVLVEGNLIKAVSTDAIGVPGAEIIDGGGRTLMPGLIDSHVHFSAYTPIAIQGRQNVNEFMVGALATVRGEAMLMRGFTTVRDTGGPSTYLRKLFDANLAPGPRVYGAEAMISQTGGHGDFRGLTNENPHFGDGAQHWYERHLGYIVDGPHEFARAARESFRNGADFFKVFVSGGVSSEFDPIHAVQSTPEELAAVVQVAEQAKTYVTAHCHTAEGVHHALDAGVHMLEHVPMMDSTPEEIEQAVGRIVESGVFVEFNTGTVLGRSLEELRAMLSPESYTKVVPAIQAYRAAIGAFAEHGAKFVYGTDLVAPWGNGTLATEERLQLAEFGIYMEFFDNLSVLKSATLWGGEVAAMTGPNNPYPEGRLGVIEEGAYADVLLVQGNPLDDPEILSDPGENLHLIMKDGIVFKNRL